VSVIGLGDLGQGKKEKDRPAQRQQWTKPWRGAPPRWSPLKSGAGHGQAFSFLSPFAIGVLSIVRFVCTVWGAM
jgi:hypothetical protein